MRYVALIVMLLLISCTQQEEMTIPVVSDANAELNVEGLDSETEVIEDTVEDTDNTVVILEETTQEDEEEPIVEITEGPSSASESSERKIDSDIVAIDVDSDLRYFPEMFLGDLDGKTVSNTFIIIGESAPSTDVIAATRIATAMNELVEDRRFRVESVLDSEVSSVKDRNAIIIGNSCDNPLVKEFLTITDCHAGLDNGEAILRLYELGGFVQLHVVGYDAQDTLRAAEYLAGYKTNNLNGKFVVVS